jgi:hypothetical protein
MSSKKLNEKTIPLGILKAFLGSSSMNNVWSFIP